MAKKTIIVKTKSVFDSAEESDGDRILVTRYWPRGISKKRLSIKEWLRNLAPSKELLSDWKNEKISWKQYTVRYHEEMLSQKEAIRNLANKASHGTITLLCFEREDDPCCHRHLLKKLIELSLYNSYTSMVRYSDRFLRFRSTLMRRACDLSRFLSSL